jgi:hypothetical protein
MGLTVPVGIGLVRVRPLAPLAVVIILSPAAPATHRHPQEAGRPTPAAAPRRIHGMRTHNITFAR